MSRYGWLVVGVIALVILSLRIDSANASPIQYYSTPVFYGKYAPIQHECYYNHKARYGFCGRAADPEEGVVGFTKLNDPTKGEGVVIRLFTEIVCAKGECKSNYGEPLGRIREQETSYWYIPTGYYLANIGPGIMAFKHGTGALAQEFPMRNVLVIPELKDPPSGIVKQHKDTIDRYEVYCNPQAECSYMGRVMLASQLHDYIPRVLTYNCDELFCYNADHSIAGLNPRAHTEAQLPKPKPKSDGLTREELMAVNNKVFK